MTNLECFKCGSNMAHRIDGGWKGEVERPYGIYFCPVCKRVFVVEENA